MRRLARDLSLGGCIVLASLSPASAFDASVSWSRVTNATGYKVYVRYDGLSSVVTSDATGVHPSTTSVTITVSNLPLGPNIFFSVASLDASGTESGKSNELLITYALAARTVDSDGDGLTDAQEDVNLNQRLDPGETDPLVADTDADGLDDGEELALGTDPLVRDSDGDGIIDGSDPCQDVDLDGFGVAIGVTTGCPPDNCPFISNSDQRDADADGSGDPCDPCTNVAGERDLADRSVIIFRKINADLLPGNDVFVLRGTLQLPDGVTITDLDPEALGARLLLRSVSSATIVTEDLPPGASSGQRNTRGWSFNRTRHRWKYIDRTGSPINGITKIVVADLGRRAPGMVSLSVVARRGTYPVRTEDVPVNATLVIGDQDAAMAGYCGETHYAAERCEFNRGKTVLSCR